MADVSVTPADVLPVTSVKQKIYTAGEAIDAGEAVYEKKDQDGIKRVYLAKATGAVEAECVGVAMDSAGAQGQPVVVAYYGIIDIGGTIVPGKAYYVSAAVAGKLGADGDLASTNYITFIGVGLTTTNMILVPLPTGEVVP